MKLSTFVLPLYFLILGATSGSALANTLELSFSGYSNLKKDPSGAYRVYAGTSGPDCGATPCNSCVQRSGASLPLTCNERRISPENGFFEISFVAPQDGLPMITVGEKGFETRAYRGTAVKKGEKVTIKQTWSDVCSNPAFCTAGVNCSPTCDRNFMRAVNVGVDPKGQSLLSTGEIAKVTLFVHKETCNINDNDGAFTTGCAVDSAPDSGIWSFEMSPGNAEAYAYNIFSVQAFPLISEDPISKAKLYAEKIRFFYAPGDCKSISKVRNSSAYFETGFTIDPRGDISILQPKVSGLKNDTDYVFKAALVDEALNVSHFTPDQVCNNSEEQNSSGNGSPVSAGKGIHVARPSAL